MRAGVVFILVMLSGCRYSPVVFECPDENRIRLGKRFMMNFPEEHASGYLWQLAPGHDNSKIMQLNTTWHGDETGVDFNFKAIDTGVTTLSFFKRKFNDTTDIRCYRVRITPN
jgi:hypothetical protein